MRFDVVPAASLGATELTRWAALQRAQPVYRSPFFRPEFTTAVARVRKVRVAVVEDADSIVGFFPFEAGPRRTGRPVSWPRGDYHGPVLEEGVELDPRELVRACGLATWAFDHLPAGLDDFIPYSFGRGRSPYIDVGEGLESYLAGRRKRSEVRDTLRKGRKLEREVGPLRFVPEDDRTDLFDRLLEWKRLQYADTGVRDVLADPESRLLLREVSTTREPGLAGTLSVLYAGDEIAALLLGVRSGTVWHSWFPVFNRDLGRYSPGLVLLLELARSAESLGIREIDLGKGDARYKTAFATDAVPLLEGCVGSTALSALPIRMRASARNVLRRAGVHRSVRRALHGIRR